jgi:lysophospholipase L1-like esterase
MRIVFYGDSITVGIPGASYVRRLRQQVPEHTVLNYSKINATPLSLYHHLHVNNAIRPADMAFILVGVNDLLIERSWLFSRIRRQWARNDEQFRDHYQRLLQAIASCTGSVVTLPPLFIGEDFDSVWQRRLANRAAIIAQLASHYPNTCYADLRSTFKEALRGKPVAPGIGQSLSQSLWDALRLHTDAAITQVAAARRLHYTLDSVHLNVAGADIVANRCLEIIQAKSREDTGNRIL